MMFLLGPIMAQCFGAVIHDKKLVKTGIISEFVGLTLCFLVGFSFGSKYIIQTLTGEKSC